MKPTTDLHIVFGTGPLGQSVIRELVRRGKNVRAVNRSGKAPAGSPPDVDWTAADAYDSKAARQVTRGAAVVYQCAQPVYTEWVEKFPRLQASILESAAANEAKLIVGENLYMYGDVNEPISEDLPYAAKTRKGTVRARMAEALFEAHQKGIVRAAVGRGSDFFGPGVTSSVVGDVVFGNLVRGKAAAVLGNPDLPHTYTFIHDFGRALVELGEHEEALGKAWHVPNAEAVTTRQFVGLAAEALGSKPRLQIAGPLLMRLLGLFVPEVREMIELEYEVIKPYQVDDSRYKKAFGDHATPLRQAIRQTVEWYRANAERPSTSR